MEADHFGQMLYTDAISQNQEDHMTISTVFINNRSQAVRLPAELRLPDSVKKVDVRAKGNERIISPAGQLWDSFFLDGPKVSDDFMEVRASQHQPERDAL
jgi:antitoxin VapB